MKNDEENLAIARLEGADVSYKDLSQVCGRIKGKKTDWAVSFLEMASEGEIPVFYARHNKKLGHRRELGGRKGRYPKKAAKIVLKVLQSAMANGRVKGLGGTYTVVVASANKKDVFPRLAPKGRQARSFLETSRVEIILKGEEVPKGVSVTPPKKPEVKKEEKKEKPKEEKPAPKAEEKKEAVEIGKEEKKEQPPLLKEEAIREHEHKHEAEKEQEQQKKRPAGKPHQHGEYQRR